MSTLAQHIILRKNEDRRLTAGHQWIFSNEVHRTVGNPANGDVVEILRSDGRSLGIGFYHAASLIAARFLSSSVEPVDAAFFHRRITAAAALRTRLYPGSDTYRVVNGESDFLPGLIVDRYGPYLSLQTFSAGMDLRLPLITEVLQSLFSPAGIAERNESPLRTLEGLDARKGLLRGTVAPVVVELNGVKFTVDILGGQKSGFFLDQRENRTALRPFSPGATVLDCFCNDGGFGLYAARYGAARVDSVDISAEAIERAKENAAMNGITTMQFHCADVFTYLEQAVKEKQQWDVVVLDPPSFTKSKKTVATALKGYREINTRGLMLTTPGGIFLSASCSHHVDRAAFLNMVQESSVKAGRKIQLLQMTGAAPDHPTLPAMPETQYLKCALFRVE